MAIEPPRARTVRTALPERLCAGPDCGVWFTPRRASHRFCRDRCRAAGYRAEHPTLTLSREEFIRAAGELFDRTVGGDGGNDGE